MVITGAPRGRPLRCPVLTIQIRTARRVPDGTSPRQRLMLRQVWQGAGRFGVAGNYLVRAENPAWPAATLVYPGRCPDPPRKRGPNPLTHGLSAGT